MQSILLEPLYSWSEEPDLLVPILFGFCWSRRQRGW